MKEEQQKDDYQCVDWSPVVRRDAGYHFRCLSHAAQIGADVEDVGDYQQCARAPQHRRE